MKSYLIQELWGGLMKDCIQVESKDKRTAIKQYLKKIDKEGVRVVQDSLKNNIMDSTYTICVQEGHYKYETKWITGRRHFYKVLLSYQDRQ